MSYRSRYGSGPSTASSARSASRSRRPCAADTYFDVVTKVNASRRRRSGQVEGVSKRGLHLLNLPAGTDVRRMREQLARMERRLNQSPRTSGEQDEETRASLSDGADAEPTDLVSRINRDVERSLLRARNGVRYVRGTHRPKLGATPKDVVWQRGKARAVALPQRPASGTGRRCVIVHSLVSRSYILDLRPGQQPRRVPRRPRAWTSSCSTGASRTSSTPTTTSRRYVDDYLPQRRRRRAARDRLRRGHARRLLPRRRARGALRRGPRRTRACATSILMATPIDFGEMGAMVAAAARGPAGSRRPDRRDRQRPRRRALQRLLHAGADDGGRAEGDAAREPLERRVRRGLPGDGAVVARPRAVPRRRVPPARRAARPARTS